MNIIKMMTGDMDFKSIKNQQDYFIIYCNEIRSDLSDKSHLLDNLLKNLNHISSKNSFENSYLLGMQQVFNIQKACKKVLQNKKVTDDTKYYSEIKNTINNNLTYSLGENDKLEFYTAICVTKVFESIIDDFINHIKQTLLDEITTVNNIIKDIKGFIDVKIIQLFIETYFNAFQIMSPINAFAQGILDAQKLSLFYRDNDNSLFNFFRLSKLKF